MSMMARFVAITPDQLSSVIDKPEIVGGLFALDAGLPTESPSELQERLRREAPQLIAEMFERLPPPIRQQLRRQLGFGENALPNRGVNDALLLQLAQREAARRRPKPKPGDAGHSVLLDKAWHGLHYLLCGALEPAPGALGQAVFGGNEIGEDGGYGPARYFAPALVAEIAGALQSPDLEGKLRARFDPPTMTELGVYPGVWESDDRDWLIKAFRTLRDFYVAASEAEHAVVTLIE